MRLIYIAGFAALASASALAEPPAGIASEAAAAVDAFHAALNRGDTAAAAALVADDALIFESGETEHSKAEYAAHHLAADAAFSQAVLSKLIRRSGGGDGNLAWIASEGRTTGNYKGRAVDSATTETMLLRRTPQGWRIVHIHWSSAR
jgi:ketosteroid isomerase-like protein